MSRFYDIWVKLVKLVGAVLKRKDFRRIAPSESFSSSISADFGFDSSIEDVPAAFRTSSKKFDPTSNFIHHGVLPIKFKEIEEATKNFHPNLLLGKGGFGPAFKGWIDEQTLTASEPGSGMAVSVKKRKLKNMQRPQAWLKEIIYLGQLHHPNLVKLIGHCFEEDNMILVYEFMPNGSLENHLFGRPDQSLSWATRIKVAIGAARVLCFLHERGIQVKYRGFKNSNILLDALSGMGLARGGEVMGTCSYDVPEYMLEGESGGLTTKDDVFGFGVVLLKLLSGMEVFNTKNLVELAKPYLINKRRLVQLMDGRLEGQYSHNGAYAVAKLALWCLSSSPPDRPRMAEVVAALEQL